VYYVYHAVSPRKVLANVILGAIESTASPIHARAIIPETVHCLQISFGEMPSKNLPRGLNEEARHMVMGFAVFRKV